MQWVRNTSVLLVLAIANTPAAAFAQRKGTRAPTPAAPAPAATGSASGSSGSGNTNATSGPDAETAAKAQQHFKRARELYQQGSYTEAIGELEAAHKLDPTAKDLVYNLIQLNEKLGRIDAAMAHMQTYMTMDLDASERARAESIARRLEGAKRELEAQKPKPLPPEKQIIVQRVTTKVEYGRVDALTVSAAVVGLAGIGVGTFFGIKALNDRPDKDFTTGRDGTYDEHARRVDDAHKNAIFADIGLAVGAAGSVAALILYFARTKHPLRPDPPAATKGAGSEFMVQGGSASWRLTF